MGKLIDDLMHLEQDVRHIHDDVEHIAKDFEGFEDNPNAKGLKRPPERSGCAHT